MKIEHLEDMLEIEYLRRMYARATDLIGTDDADAVAEGSRIYHRIFTEDVDMRSISDGEIGFSAQGAAGWVDVVIDALADYAATQHLIGTQLVTIERIEKDADGRTLSGEATMESYLQAWHEHKNGNVWLFLGTYLDKVRFNPDVGWQIYDMTLTEVSGETRPMGRED